MDAFSYLSVLLSIILGLAITEVLQGFRGLMHARSRTIMYWPVIAWGVLVVVIAVQGWWTMFGYRHIEDWNFLEFSVVLLQTIVVYLLAALALPDVHGDAAVDLRKHYYEHANWFFTMLLALIFVSLLKSLAVEGKLPDPADLTFHGLFAALSLSGIVIRAPRFHESLAALGLLLMGSYIATLFVHLRP
jgi:hypothetical protein